jgi:hypothetical protein
VNRIAFASDVIDAEALFADVLLAAPEARLPLVFRSDHGPPGAGRSRGKGFSQRIMVG